MNLYSTVTMLAQGGASKSKCPRCGSKDYRLMPTDFETAKCNKCGKTWDHGIVSGINDPSDVKAGQTDSSSFVGRKYRVVDTKYGHYISEHDNPEEAEKAAQARPWSKVLSEPDPAQTQEVRDIARQRLVKTNPDVD